MFNVVICGTPGTGKTTLIERIRSSDLKCFKFVNVSEFAIKNKCIEEYDDELETHVIDEDRLNELLEPQLRTNEKSIIECIHGDMLPRELVNLVFVCRADNSVLYDRLVQRRYKEEKISQNIQAEIFQTILDEVRDSLANDNNSEIEIIELSNNTLDDLEKNLNIVVGKIKSQQEI